MPKEGHISVTISRYVWDEAERCFENHKVELRKKGIKSTSALCRFCIEHAEMIIKASNLLMKA
jgi:hypothetical protein